MKKTFATPQVNHILRDEILTQSQQGIVVSSNTSDPNDKGDGDHAPARATSVTVPFPKVMRN